MGCGRRGGGERGGGGGGEVGGLLKRLPVLHNSVVYILWSFVITF